MANVAKTLKRINRKIRRARAKVDKHISTAQKAFDVVFPPPTKGRRP